MFTYCHKEDEIDIVTSKKYIKLSCNEYRHLADRNLI